MSKNRPHWLDPEVVIPPGLSYAKPRPQNPHGYWKAYWPPVPDQKGTKHDLAAHEGSYPQALGLLAKVKAAYDGGCVTLEATPKDPTTRDAQKFRSDYHAGQHGPTNGKKKKAKRRSKAEIKAAVMRHNGICTILAYTGRMMPGDEVKIATDKDDALIGKAGVMYMSRNGSGGDAPGTMFVECVSEQAREIIEYKFLIPVVKVWFETLEDELLRDMGY